MSGSVLGTGLPFLGPAIAAWITVIVGVMAFYFLSVSREYRTRGVNGPPQRRQSTIDAQRNEQLGSPWGTRWDRVQPSQVSFRSDVGRAAGSEGQPQSALPAYDMENYPDEKWGTRVDAPPATPIVSGSTDA